ncbi:hypothetical protein [Pseudoflavitalea rhizosphaerae]|uniref:hypothetical protein n=1 Tax=Pseudoflavitalea rhizosphaerae TaxID=1884793 RepID=UPI0013E0C135|nr:hypothetical protein [Pseudoflavitalea rhizosphaerae]
MYSKPISIEAGIIQSRLKESHAGEKSISSLKVNINTSGWDLPNQEITVMGNVIM